MNSYTNPLALSLKDARDLEEDQRLRRFQKAWKAYQGDAPRPLRPRAGSPDDNVILNFAKVIVDKGAASLFGKPVSFELAGADTSGTGIENPAQEWLDQVWKTNNQGLLLTDLATNGGVTGHVFVKIQPAASGERYPRIVVLDPATVYPTWDPHDIRRVLKWRIQYNYVDPDSDEEMVCRQMITPAGMGWQVQDQVAHPGRDDWRVVEQVQWPYPFPPCLECKNLPAPNQFWGMSDIEKDAQHIMEVINRLISNLNKITRIHAHPKLWLKGADPSQANAWDASIDKIMVLMGDDAAVGALNVLSDFAAPMALYGALTDALHEVCRLPEVALGKLDNVGPISGAALQILYGPLVEKTNTKHLTYGYMLEDLNRRLLVLGGFGAYDDLDVTTQWPDVTPTDPLAQAQTLLLHKQLGVSSDTLMQTLGYDPDDERQKNLDNQETFGFPAKTDDPPIGQGDDNTGDDAKPSEPDSAARPFGG